MVDRNDFKLLKQRCLRHFELAKNYLGDKKLDLDDNQKARYGFYFFIIQNLTNLVDYDKMVEAITDTEFNSTFFDVNDVDEGIDAKCWRFANFAFSTASPPANGSISCHSFCLGKFFEYKNLCQTNENIRRPSV